MNIHLKPFQETAIADLRKQFLELWKTGKRKIPIIFKAPTGSGKTVMIAQFLKDMAEDPQFMADKAYLWFSFSEDSCKQSKSKLFEYYGGANELDLLDISNLDREKLERDNVFFINWQKIKSSTKEGRILRTPTENTIGDDGIFDELIKKTQGFGRELILIVDEAHRDTDTELADELVDLVDPRIILKITATPKTEPTASDVLQKRIGWIEVDHEAVVNAGLIKEKIVTQSKEDLETLAKKEIDQDLILLELAFTKRKELIEYYKELDLDINPMVLIQLPNDDHARKETLDKSKLDIVKDFLNNKKIHDSDIATWLADGRENLDLKEIKKNDSNISFLIFKQAAGTGWDCPRASILVMFREIKSPIFHTQTIGRILRMPEALHYPKPELNIGYLYTNYERNQIQLPNNKQGKNKPFVYYSERKLGIKTITLESTFMGRTDYNDLGDSFQISFKEVADRYFDIKSSDVKNDIVKKVANKGIELENVKIKNKLIVDAQIENYDNFIEEITKKGDDLDEQTSENDIERMYNLVCFNIIARQEEENKKFAPERSWGKLKTALNVWVSSWTNERRKFYYIIILNDLFKIDSVLRKIIAQALEAYKPLRQAEVRKREERAKTTEKLELPRPIMWYTDDYEEVNGLKKIAVQPFYIGKKYNGRNNEIKFVEYIETKKIDWWYKNGGSGSDNYSIPYYDDLTRKERLFYPDWIIRKKDTIYILDTKQGLTGTVGKHDTKLKAEALQDWIKKQKDQKFIGGIISSVSDIWKINNNDKYNIDVNYSEWNLLDDLI